MNADALSDLVLALVGLSIARQQLRVRPALAVGALLIGLAAAMGVLRYAGLSEALGPHRFLSLLAACAGFPLLALAVRWPDDPIARHVTAAGRFVLIAGAIGVVLTLAGATLWRDLLPAAAVLAIALTAVEQRQAPLIIAALALIAALVIAGLQLSVGPLNTVQALHYLLAIGLLRLSWVNKSPVTSQ